MLLEGPAGTSFELRAVGYQFPDTIPSDEPFDHDANWLVMSCVVNNANERWQFRDPCLLTVELGRLAAWFDQVADGTASPERIDFTEPNLAFQCLSSPADPPVIRVTFGLEARPPGHRFSGDDDDWGTVSVDFPVTADSLAKAAGDLRADLDRFPPRGRDLYSREDLD